MKEPNLTKEREFGISWIDRLVAENNDVIEINSDKIKRAFYDTDNLLKFEYTDGSIGAVADADINTIKDGAKVWEMAHESLTKTIVIQYLLGKPITHKNKVVSPK